MKLHSIITESTFKMPADRLTSVMTPGFIRLDKVFKQAGYEVRVVGGAVRDIMSGNEPKDIDLATDATPDVMMKILDDAGIRHEPTGLQHGTITAIIDDEPIEITTLRIDSNQDGRHADVEFTTDWREDAERRDLTFNAMNMTLDGTVHDYFNGVEDLKAGVARFVGDPVSRITEDYLRILRYFRFQGRLKHRTWDNDVLTAIRKTISGLAGISGERIWSELSNIFSKSSRKDVIKHMSDAGVLQAIGMSDKNLNKLNTASKDPAVVLGILLSSVVELEKLRSRLKFSTDIYLKTRFIIENKNNEFNEMIAKQMLTNPKIPTNNVFALAHALGRDDLAQKLAGWAIPIFPVTGGDLIAAGVTPGPEMGRLLSSLRSIWVDKGYMPSKLELLSYIK